jgi:UDP-N-acetylmuramate--alanine ligase
MSELAATIGAGLAPARRARAIRAGERIHVVGAAGAGASAAAMLAHFAGGVVSGCDPGMPSPYTPALDAAGIAVAGAHDPAHVTTPPHPERLAVTKALTAIEPDHPELVAARDAGIPLEAWQQVVADAAAGRRLVAVAGTHGKSTTAGWLTHVLVAAGADPSAFVGALLGPEVTGGLPGTARWGGGEAFIVEADEYAGNFDAYHPSVAAVTSIDWDHPDVFPDRASIVAAFEAWLHAAAAETRNPPTIVANVSDAGVRELLDRIPGWPGAIVTVASARGDDKASADVVGTVAATKRSGTAIDVAGLANDPVRIELLTAGRHNVANALVVAATARELGLENAQIAAGLASFAGVGRRMERKGESGGVVVYDDYGHHPTAILATIEAIRQREPGRRVWAVYEPLTFHRTAAFLGAFADALSTADAVAIADIWASRDRDTSVASAQGLATAVSRRRPELTIGAPGSPEATADWLAREVRDGDAVLVMGGGKSYQIAERLLAILAGR